MKPENRKFLDDNRHHHFTLVNAQYMKGLNANERDGMLRVMGEEFQPGYYTDLWCPPCVSDMVLLLYRRYDEWLAANVGPTHDKSLNTDLVFIEEAGLITDAQWAELNAGKARSEDNGWVPGSPDADAEVVDLPQEPPKENSVELPPASIDPAKVAASFPSNKKHRRK
jgi:hypothetical protein